MLAKDGYAVRHIGATTKGPDLNLRPYGAAEIPEQLWDLKSTNKTNNIDNAFKNSFRETSRNFEYFINNNVAIRVVIDMSPQYSKAEVIAKIQRIQAEGFNDLKKALTQMQELLVYCTDGVVYYAGGKIQ